MITIKRIIEFAGRLEDIAPGFLISVISAETREDYRRRDVLDQVARVIEIFGVTGAAEIVGCC
jgi:hypothetical protein